MTTLDALSTHADTSAARPEVDAAVEQLSAGEPLACLLLAEATARTAALDQVLARVVDEGTRIVWVGNPLRSPLTLERLFMQVLGPEVDLRVERSPAELTTLLARAPARRSHLLIVVQQPETLAPETLATLGRMAPYFAGADPSIQILFCGPPGFTLPEPSPPASTALTVKQPVLDEAPSARRKLFRRVLLVLMLVGAGVIYWQNDPTAPAPVPSNPAPAADLAPKDPAPAPPAPPPRRAEQLPPAPTEDVAALRREFEAFLAERSPALASLSEREKDALFAEFLARHRQTATP